LNALFPVEPTMLMVVAAGGAAVVGGEGVEGLDGVDGVVGVPPPLPPPHPRVSTQIISDRCFIMPRQGRQRECRLSWAMMKAFSAPARCCCFVPCNTLRLSETTGAAHG
jgi:hypothetical protein